MEESFRETELQIQTKASLEIPFLFHLNVLPMYQRSDGLENLETCFEVGIHSCHC